MILWFFYFYYFYRNTQNSLNVFKWELTGTLFERNLKGGIELILPYLHSYDENITHVVVIDNNTFVHNSDLELNIGGHFTKLNITHNTIQNNICKGNLLSGQLLIFSFN